MGEQGGLNLYAYVRNHVTDAVDPLGLWPPIGMIGHLADPMDPEAPATYYDQNGKAYAGTTSWMSSNNWSGWVIGAGVGAVRVINGRTAVRISSTDFYITGVSQKGMWNPPRNMPNNTVLYVYKKGSPKKCYRLDYHTLEKGPLAGKIEGWHHNQQGVSEVLKVNEFAPLGNGSPAGRRGSLAGRSIKVLKWGGRAVLIVGVGSAAYDIYHADNVPREIVKQASGFAGAYAGGWVGGKAGAAGGAAIGAWVAGAGALPGAVIGGIIGSVGGGIGGYYATATVSTTIYDLVAQPLEEEEYVIMSSE